MDTPARVLLIASTAPARAPLSVAVQTLRRAGVTVRLAAYDDRAGRRAGLTADEARSLTTGAQEHGPAFRRALRRADPPKRLWLHLKHDAWIAEQLPGVDAVVALDTAAARPARRLARLGGAVAARDVEAAVRAVGHGTRRGTKPTPWARRTGLPATVAGQVSRWPALSDRRRYELAGRSAGRLLAAGRTAAAESVVGRAARRITAPRLRADLLGDLVNAVLARGIASAHVTDAYAAELDVADRQLAKKRYGAAAAAFEEAMRVAFHRVLHLDRLASPLASDPTGYTAALRDSATARALRAPRGRTRWHEPAPVESRPTRVLIATRTNDNFLGEIRAHLDAHPAFEGRFVDFASAKDLTGYARDPARIVQEVLAQGHELGSTVERHLRPHLDWADVVLVEWCAELAVLATMIDPGHARVVVRLHSFELFKQWPQLVDFSRVDDLLFVSDHVRDLAVDAIPALLRHEDAPRLRVLPNAMVLRPFVRDKTDTARFTIGLVGWSRAVKDPRWAIQVLRRLRKHDDRFGLLLIGGADFNDRVSNAARAYESALRDDLAELEAAGAVRQLGRTDDVPSALTEVGVILSSSVRESFHAAVVEGAASGAVPVVRDWPYFAARPSGARTLFPADWVVGSPEEAVARILQTTASDEVWRRTGTAAAEHALRQWDWEVVKGGYERLLARSAGPRATDTVG